MSLQVWLPLNGNLNNQGLSNVTVTNYGATIESAGKIGQCYNFDGTDDRITVSGLNLNNTWSYGCWIYSATSTRGWEGILILNNNGGDSDMQLGFYTYPTGNRIQNTANGQFNSGINWTYGQWHHFFGTFDGNNLKTYIDGVCVDTKTISSELLPRTNFTIGARSKHANGGGVSADCFFQGKINDVRIYDHCLSPKEVKELAKGLVLHYKLDGKNETTTNLITTEDGLSSTAYNASVGKYGYNTDSNMQKTVGDYNGMHCTKVSMITAGVSAHPYVYFSNIFVSNGTNQPAYKTLSFDYYGTIGTYVNFYKLGSGSGTGAWKNTTLGQSGSWTNSGNITVEPNKWNHIELTLHGTTDANAEFGYCILGDTHTTAASNYWLFANVQIETKDHATPYVGVGGSRTYITEYDCSGYGYNGTPIGEIPYSNDTIRYKKSLSLNGTDEAIQVPYNTTVWQTNFTINLWWKKTEIGPENYETLFGGPSGFEMDTRAGSSTALTLYMTGTRGGSVYTGFELNNWYMVTMVNDGVNELYYVNGNLVETIEKKSMPSGNYFIGAWSNSSSQNYKGLISDFRIYATALSADDVKELYQTSASIDNKGNVYTYELEEV